MLREVLKYFGNNQDDFEIVQKDLPSDCETLIAVCEK